MTARRALAAWGRRLTALYDQRRTWCRWCQDAPSGEDGFCSRACAAEHLKFEAALGAP